MPTELAAAKTTPRVFARTGRQLRGLAFIGLIAVVAVAFLGLLLVPVAGWLGGDAVASLTGKEHADAIDATRSTLLQAAAGLLALGALVFTARTYLLGREGQVTDRYTKAVDQLGAQTLAQRTGGVYALERIMQDSPKDHWAVVQVLAAFIRTQSTVVTANVDRGSESDGPDSDVKAALTVLGRRPRRQDKELDRVRLSDSDLRRTLLRCGRLDKAALRGARLEKVHWESASLVRARLRNAKMYKADLVGADLHRAELQEADLTNAKLTDADLTDADLTDARLGGAELTGAVMRGAHLAGVRAAAALSPTQRAEAHCLPDVERCPHRAPR